MRPFLAPSVRPLLIALGCVLAFSLVAAQGPAPGAGRGPGAPDPAQGQGGGARGGRGAGQGPARDTPAQTVAIGTASIAGVVTLGGSGTPVRRAQVTLSGGGRGGRTTVTNEEGRFTFVALPAGRFNLNVTKPGYVSMSYGAKKPGRQGTPIQLVDGQVLTNANITLPKGSVLTGIVVDEHGEPSPNTQVRAYRYVLQNGESTLQQAGQNQTDDRGIYRIFQLLPGDYVVSAVPRNSGFAGIAEQIQAQLQPLIQQVQAAGGADALLGVGGRGGGGRGGALADALGGALGGGRGQQMLDQIQQLQQQLAQQPEQTTAYAPVYFPGTTTASQAGKIALEASQERVGVDFQLQLVATAKVTGLITGMEGASPQGTQITLQLARQQGVSSIPGLGSSNTRVDQNGAFAFQGITPGQYRLMVRAPVRQPDTAPGQDPQAAPAGPGGRGGRGGRGGPGQITQVLWASTDISVDGRDVTDLSLTLQPGMTISGRVGFEAGATPPADLTVVRVNMLSMEPGTGGGGPMVPQQVDATGNFSITGVVPGRYGLRANVAGARAGGPGALGVGPRGGGVAAAAQAAGGAAQTGVSWTLKSAVLNGVDALDFPLDIEPNQNLTGAMLTFTDKVQELSGTLQDSMGRPTADYTIVLFPTDPRYWVPQSRRILSTRPSTDGKFSFRGFPAGQYRLTAVIDAEPGEWYDPSFLAQVVPASMLVSVTENEKKTQDIRLATAQ